MLLQVILEGLGLGLRDFAEKHGMFQYEYYVDDGYTGRNFNRPSFQRMIADIETEMCIRDRTITLRELPTAQPVPMLRMADVELILRIVIQYVTFLILTILLLI